MLREICPRYNCTAYHPLLCTVGATGRVTDSTVPRQVETEALLVLDCLFFHSHIVNSFSTLDQFEVDRCPQLAYCIAKYFDTEINSSLISANLTS